MRIFPGLGESKHGFHLPAISTKSLGDEHLLFSAVWTDIKMPSISCSTPAWWLIRLDMLRNGCHSSLPFCTSDKFRSRCLQMWTPLQLAGVKPWKETHKKSQETNESTESTLIRLGIHWNLIEHMESWNLSPSFSWDFSGLREVDCSAASTEQSAHLSDWPSWAHRHDAAIVWMFMNWFYQLDLILIGSSFHELKLMFCIFFCDDHIRLALKCAKPC